MPASAVKTTSDITRGFSNSTKSRNSGSTLRSPKSIWAVPIRADEMSVKNVVSVTGRG
jgi:hypothetical protein